MLSAVARVIVSFILSDSGVDEQAQNKSAARTVYVRAFIPVSNQIEVKKYI